MDTTQTVVFTAAVTSLIWIAINVFRGGRRWIKLEARHQDAMQKLRDEYRAERQAAHEKRMAELKAEGDAVRADIQRRTDALQRRAEIDEALLPIIRRLDKIAPRPAKELITELETSLEKREN